MCVSEIRTSSAVCRPCDQDRASRLHEARPWSLVNNWIKLYSISNDDRTGIRS